MLNYLQRWIGQLRGQRLKPFQKLAESRWTTWMESQLLPDEGTSGSVGLNGNIQSLLRRGRGYKNLRYLLLN